MSDLQVERPDTAASRSLASRPRILRLAAPRRRNALTLETVDRLHAELAEDPEAILVLGSSTPDIFSAGADLAADDQTRATLSDRLYACYERMLLRPGPVIAVVEGPAVGGGAQLCAAADIRLASPGARWRWAGPGHGLAVGGWILPELVGRARALDLTMTGRWLDAPEALACGFTSRVDDDPWARAFELLDTLATADAAALGRLKEITADDSVRRRLALERAGNFTTWSGSAPSARDAASQGRNAGRG